MQNLVDSIGTFLTEPFSEDLDVFTLFLLVGLVLIFAMLWGVMLEAFRRAGSAVVEAI